MSIARALPHRDTVRPEETVEILPYERVEGIVADNDLFAVGICSCRHEKLHVGPQGLRRAARDLRVLRRGRRLLGKTPDGPTAASNPERCVGCGSCAKACPGEAIELKVIGARPSGEEIRRARVDTSLCLGCGVCALECKRGAMMLTKRDRAVLHPETFMERSILAAFERGNLQNLSRHTRQPGTQGDARGRRSLPQAVPGETGLDERHSPLPVPGRGGKSGRA